MLISFPLDMTTEHKITSPEPKKEGAKKKGGGEEKRFSPQHFQEKGIRTTKSNEKHGEDL